MLPKSLRVNLSTDFKTIVGADRAESANFKYYFLKTSNNLTKVGIALSKNYFKKAVLRNKARRKTSQIIESLYSDLPKGMNLIIMPKSQVLELEIENLKKEIFGVKKIFH